MSDNQITNGRRAALALDAISTYTRMSPYEGLPEDYFFFLDSERETGPGTDHDRLAGLLCGLMHYAERRRLSFADTLAGARRDYNRQRTSYLPGDAVQVQRTTASDSAPLTGEIARARPGRPPSYLIDFITSREWVAEPDLTPAEPFPATATRYGEISSAHIARNLLTRTIARIEIARENGNYPDTRDVQDLGIFLTALCRWSGLERPTVLRAFSEVLTEKDGHLLIAGTLRTHPVALRSPRRLRPGTPAKCSDPGPASQRSTKWT